MTSKKWQNYWAYLLTGTIGGLTVYIFATWGEIFLGETGKILLPMILILALTWWYNKLIEN